MAAKKKKPARKPATRVKAKKPAKKPARKTATKRPAKRAAAKPVAAPAATVDLKLGDRAPDFKLATDGGGSLTLSSLRGKTVVLYFYPRDDTPGCTKEACGFNDALPDFRGVNAEIVGVSKDNGASHDRFRDKYGLRFRLAADVDTAVAKSYGVWVKKSMYGQEYMGMDRSTFLIDRDGIVRRIWRGVKVDGHVPEVLQAVRGL